MKKFTAMALAALLCIGALAGCFNAGNDTPTDPTGNNQTPGGDSTGTETSLQILQKIWEKYDESEKFASFGGNAASPVDNAPGAFDMTNQEELASMLVIDDTQAGKIQDAASLVHMMNANVFTCAAFTLAQGQDVEAFASAQKTALVNNRWICGQPSGYLLVKVDQSHVVMAFGDTAALELFRTNLASAYPNAQILFDEAMD